MKPATKRKRPKEKEQKSMPFMIECDECGGHGEVQASCDVCNISLTTFNVEPGTDDLCRECAAKEEAWRDGDNGNIDDHP